MLPAIVLAALIASGLIMSKRDTVSEAPPATTGRQINAYADPGMVEAARLMDRRSAAKAQANSDPTPPGTVYSPLRGAHVPVEDMNLKLQPFYRGAAPGPIIDREKAAPPDPKREVFETRGWEPVPRSTMEADLNKETYGAAASLSATRQGELLHQPMREQRPEAEVMPRVMPPNIDTLRGYARPRYVDKGRIIPGSSPVAMRTSAPNVPKRSPDQFRTTTDEDFVPNTGPAERHNVHPQQVLAPTARGLGASNYMSHASASSRWGGAAGQVTTNPKFSPAGLPVGGATRAGAWNFEADQSASQFADSLRPNERDVLSGPQQTAFPLTGVKAAPGTSYVTPERERTDWNVRAVTTAAPRVYGNMRGASAMKQTMHDPNMVMRTTMKETMIHDTTMGIAGPRADRVTGRNDDVPDPTVRNTLQSVDSNANLAPANVKPVVYDPNDIFEPTHRDTLGDAQRTGNVDTMPAGQGYMTADVKAENTQRQFQHREYAGIADREGGDGYKTVGVDAPNTQRQFVGDSGVQYGPSGSVNTKKSMSYADIYAARMKGVKESILGGRAPTNVGPMLMKGAQDPDLRMESSRDPYMELSDRPAGYVSRQGAVQNPTRPDCRQDTKRVNALPAHNDRHDGFTETSALRTNPYALSVTRESPTNLPGERGMEYAMNLQPSQPSTLPRQGLPQSVCADEKHACLVTRPTEAQDIGVCQR